MESAAQRRRFERLRRLVEKSVPALTIRVARRYLLRYPSHGLAWMLIGGVLVEVGRYEEAEQAFAKAIELCPIERIRHIPTSHMGHLFRETGDFSQAAVWYRKAIALAPEDAGNHIYLGAVLAKGGRLTEAEEAFRSSIQCPEGCMDEAYLNLGLVLRARERFVEAAECFREALLRDPQYRSARQALRDVERCIRFESRQ